MFTLLWYFKLNKYINPTKEMLVVMSLNSFLEVLYKIRSDIWSMSIISIQLNIGLKNLDNENKNNIYIYIK